MQRDKRGRFVKKAFDGTILTVNNFNWKVKQGAKQAYDAFKAGGGTDDFQTWAMGSGIKYLEPATSFSEQNGVITSLNQPLKLQNTFSLQDPLGTKAKQDQLNSLDTFHMMHGDNADYSSLAAPEKIQYMKNDKGEYVDLNGNAINLMDLTTNPHRYSLKVPEFENIMSSEPSAGMTVTEDDIKGNKSKFVFDRNRAADFLEWTRAGIGAHVNNKIAERALKAEKPFLQDVSESHHNIYGDYRSKIRGEQAAAQLRNAAAQPLTSDGALQQQMMLEAQIKGQEYIDSGNAADEATIKQTREIAWQQEKENRQQRQAVAMANKQAMLMSQRNKSQIENMRDSANFSQVVSPLLAATEQRLRAKAAETEAYQEQYDSALVANQVWNDPNLELTDVQKQIRNIYLDQGVEGVSAFIGTDEAKNSEWLRLSQLMKNETIKRQAALKGVYVNPASLNTISGNYGIFGGGSKFKKGGTIYKAKLSKRTRDNDRASKSIEASKKIAARFLEKAMDSLYTYDDVELIAKPKKRKRKYQAGGGLPFVGFTPVFASSEKGAPTAATTTAKSSDDDLTSKDILELLKDMDGLPSDMQIIVSSLKNFELSDQMDPLGLSSSSNIASRYISLINKIKVAKFNRDEYNNAFNQLKGNGGLNEYAITSEGLLIGTNKDGDFEYFTPDQVNQGEPRTQGYTLLTNSNLLYLRANSIDAAFNHQLTTFAQNGIGMEVITKQVNDIISGLGSTKESEEGFVQMGQKGRIIEGLKFLQKAAQEVGDDSIADTMSVADYYQAGYLTEEQAQQAQFALNYIWGALPANAQSLLQVKGGSAKGAEALIQSLVYSKTSTNTQFKATPKKMSKGASGSKDGADELKLTPVQMMQVGYTDHMPVTLQRGTAYATQVNAQVLPITDINKKSLGITTLDKVAESTFGGALDMNNVTMGSQSIDPQALQNVQIDATNLYVMNLPIDRSAPDGTIRPDLSWMKKIEEIDRTIRDQGITDVATINQLYVDAGLPVLMDDNGQLNIRDYCKFGVLNGHALNSAFKDRDLLDNTIIEIDDEDQINNIMSILNKDRGEKDRLDFDSESWFDSIFGTDHDSVFEGTIYIPVRTNAFTGMIGGGQYPDTATAEEVEALIQQHQRTRGYVDPGLLN